MCCHNGHGAKQVLSALRSVDTSITEKDSAFWHKTLGSQGGGTAKADPEKALAAIDAAWLAATKNNKDWSAMTAQERLDAQAQFRSLREHVEGGEIALTENQVLKLGSYVTKRKATPRIAKVGAVAAGLLVSMGVVAGSAPQAAAAELPKPAPISANAANANALHMPVGKNGMCATDFTLAKAGKTHKVTWKKPGGKVTTKVMKKGSKACVYVGKDGQAVPAPTNPTDGTITGLPANFPKNPTAADIASLGLTKDSKVDPSVRLPKPTGGAMVQPQLAESIKPVRVLGTSIEKVGEAPYETTKEVVWIEWEITGGQGALSYGTRDGQGAEQYQHFTSLNPNGSIRVIQPVQRSAGNPTDQGGAVYNFRGYVTPDYGQTNLPSTMTRDWNLMSERAQDSSGDGFTAGKYANTANPFYIRGDGHKDDGFVQLDDNLNILGTY